ncbi:uncharacterized protein LOC132727894 isoform X2 [Ruditapes philippinarum]|uniref:uncharacterized protein LOC132727894 isoform X2 n=1 Tax=Ruditapes philippinarum TaxID=129788 RepID=UPI00295B9A62|nr:uncharacterized protein LOC132727894 isoform X2 [Ruditapes philippinarum]
MVQKCFYFAVFGTVAFFLSTQVGGDNELDSCKISSMEHLLDKMIRTETKVESMLNEIRNIEEHVLSILEYRKQHNQNVLAQMKESHEAAIENVKAEIESIKPQKGLGSSYVRWGRTTCPTDNELNYKGYAAGSNWVAVGGAGNFLCLTEEPQWGSYDESRTSGAKVYGAEYEFSDYHADGGSKFFKKNLNDQDAPCSVCRTPRSAVTMIPGRHDCFPGWTKEYSGYLVAGSEVHKSPTEYICLDSDAEMLSNGGRSNDGRVIYIAEAVCGTLRCPPYIQGRELTCVVCSK